MKNTVFCLVLFLSFCGFFACASQPPELASPPEPPPPPPPIEAPPPPSVEADSSFAADLVLDGAETYIVVRRDTLSKIARKKFGSRNGFYYPLIMMASNIAIKDQDLLEPGMVLTIPRLRANLNSAKAKASMKKFFLETAAITNRKRPRDGTGLRRLANSL
ncbi:MAG: LysM peptidoglycan-binding domain-containing protein [Treponema sp.]|jgi:hypothetical protein|nr:LysM peptidoglycan-binding domain-containing protein [Treponema sp.]